MFAAEAKADIPTSALIPADLWVRLGCAHCAATKPSRLSRSANARRFRIALVAKQYFLSTVIARLWPNRPRFVTVSNLHKFGAARKASR
jgi:hypothetical protein